MPVDDPRGEARFALPAEAVDQHPGMLGPAEFMADRLDLAAPADEFEAAGDLDAAAAGLEDVLAPEIGVGGTARASRRQRAARRRAGRGTAAPDANAPAAAGRRPGLSNKKRATAQAASSEVPRKAACR